MEEETAQLDSGEFGGQYEANQNSDGTWTIYDVPIMGPLPAGARRNAFPIGKKWMQKAIENHARCMSEGYIAPLHVYHHDQGKETQSAGMFLPKKISQIRMGGRSVPVILADLMRVPEEVFEEIQALRLAYRSPEVAKWEDPQLASLALLPDEAPYFKLPLLTVEATGGRVGRLKKEATPAIAMCVGSGGGSILFRMQTSTQEENKEMGDERKFGFSSAEDEHNRTKMAEDIDDIEEKETEDMSYKMMSVLSKIAQKLGIEEDEDDNIDLDEDEADEEEVEINIEDKAPFDQEESEDESEETYKYSDSRIAKLRGKVAALEQANRFREKKETVSVMAEKAIAALSDWEIDKDTVKAIHKMAAAGPDALSTFVESFKRSTPQDPPETFGDFEVSGVTDIVKDEVMKFREKGPETFEAAQMAAREWEELNARGRTDVALDRFIEIQLEHGEHGGF